MAARAKVVAIVKKFVAKHKGLLQREFPGCRGQEPYQDPGHKNHISQSTDHFHDGTKLDL